MASKTHRTRGLGRRTRRKVATFRFTTAIRTAMIVSLAGRVP